jgi:hypothetical protein
VLELVVHPSASGVNMGRSNENKMSDGG